jgi:hypothetical protein
MTLCSLVCHAGADWGWEEGVGGAVAEKSEKQERPPGVEAIPTAEIGLRFRGQEGPSMAQDLGSIPSLQN